MRPRGLFCLAFGVILALAAWLRLDRLATPYDADSAHSRYRPMHSDEAVQAVKLSQLLEEGEYLYDPKDYHGPVLLYATLPVAWARGQTKLTQLDEWTLRVVPVAFGLAAIALLVANRKALGSWPLLVSALLLAVSPAMVYYSRYYIMELPLVFFIALAMWALERYSRKPSWAWALVMGAAGGFTHATKETGIVSFFAIMVAGFILWRASLQRPPLRWSHVLGAVFLGLVVSALCFSVLGRHWPAVVDSFTGYLGYLHRAEGAGGHEKPWYYYLQILAYNREGRGPIWSEGLILIPGLLGAGLAFTPWAARVGRPLVYRFLSIQTLVCLAVYSIIPYKTPWSMLCWHFTLALLAGFTFALLGSIRRPAYLAPALALGILVLGVGNLYRQTQRSLFPFQADTRNPYVYSHTAPNLLKAVSLVRRLSKLHPDGPAMRVAVIQEDYGWPLPWYFRDMPHVGYWPKPPPDWKPEDIVISSRAYDGDVAPKLKDSHEYVSPYGMREGLQVDLYVERSLYARYMASIP